MKQLLIGLSLSLLAGCTSIAYQYEPAPTEFAGIWYQRLMGVNHFYVIREDGTGILCMESGSAGATIFDLVVNGENLYTNLSLSLSRQDANTLIMNDGFIDYELTSVKHASAKCNPYLG